MSLRLYDAPAMHGPDGPDGADALAGAAERYADQRSMALVQLFIRDDAGGPPPAVLAVEDGLPGILPALTDDELAARWARAAERGDLIGMEVIARFWATLPPHRATKVLRAAAARRRAQLARKAVAA